MLLALFRHGIAEDAGPRPGTATRRGSLDRPPGPGASTRRPPACVGSGSMRTPCSSSPLDRCLETAQIVAAALDVTVRRTRAPTGSHTAALLAVLAEYPDAGCVLACGHQPDLSYITQELTGGVADYRRGTLGLVELGALRPGHGMLVGLYPAKVLRRVGRTP